MIVSSSQSADGPLFYFGTDGSNATNNLPKYETELKQEIESTDSVTLYVPNDSPILAKMLRFAEVGKTDNGRTAVLVNLNDDEKYISLVKLLFKTIEGERSNLLEEELKTTLRDYQTETTEHARTTSDSLGVNLTPEVTAINRERKQVIGSLKVSNGSSLGA